MARILIFTGDGKGKTTAALGTVLRASGHGKKCLIVQFIKANDKTGELISCSRLPGVEIVQMGCGFLPDGSNPDFEKHRTAALNALAYAERALASDRYDIVVLDEICVALAKRLIDENRLLQILERGVTASCIILTGREASRRLIERADTVTEMNSIRHAVQQGIGAQEGVEY